MILVTGGNGFVGRAVVQALHTSGHDVRILVRDPAAVNPRSFPAGTEIVRGDITKPETLKAACTGVQGVIHLVGIIVETGGDTYTSVHLTGTKNILAAAKAAGATRFVHMSALGARPNARSCYHITKFEAEEKVRESGLDWTIFQPSIIFGEHDGFVNLFADLMRPPLLTLSFGVVPCVGGGTTVLQPIAVGDVARCFAQSVSDPSAIGQTYPLGGQPFTLREIMEAIAKALGLEPAFVDGFGPASHLKALALRLKGFKPVFIALPFPLARTAAFFFEWLPTPPLTNDQITMLEENNPADPALAEAVFGVKLQPFLQGIRSYLKPSQN
jgi:uncharacterized protein YbjT (DUF2867 family)